MTLYIPGFTELTLAETYRMTGWTSSTGCNSSPWPYHPPPGWGCDPSFTEVHSPYTGSHGGCPGCLMTQVRVIANYQTEVTFITNPIGAQIFIDGVEWWPGTVTAIDGATFRGISPATDPTPHTYELRKAGYISATGTFQVVSEITTISETLLQPSNITIQDVTIEGISCISGCTITCPTSCPEIVDIDVTWANSGGFSGTFTPTITIAGGIPIIGAQITIVPGLTGTTTFLGVSLPQGTLNICIDSGIIT